MNITLYTCIHVVIYMYTYTEESSRFFLQIENQKKLKISLLKDIFKNSRNAFNRS
jgi:hypothetical protein